MIFDLVSENSFSDQGFLSAIQPAPLGNALSTMANFAEFSSRTGVTTLYGDLANTPAMDICAEASSAAFTCNGCAERFDVSGINILSQQITSYIGGGGATQGLASRLRMPRDLARLRSVANSIVVLAAPQRFDEFEDLEGNIAQLCARGNGVFVTGAYWLQYMQTGEAMSADIRSKLRLVDQVPGTSKRIIPSEGINIAVHMRRGRDYQIWFGGKYFFSVEQIVTAMRALAIQMPRSHFHVFTNERFEREEFPADLRVSVCPGELDTSDFINMGKCQLIVGPPSTFATWAAYLGAAQRLVLTPETIEGLSEGQPLQDLVRKVVRPTFSYAPGVDGPL